MPTKLKIAHLPIQYRLYVIILAIILATGSLWFSSNNLSFNTDTKDMLSSELAWRKADIKHNELFPQYKEEILILIEAPTPDQSQDAALAMYEKLHHQNDLFKTVYYPQGLDYFKRSAFLFLDIDELYELQDQLVTIQPLLGRLLHNPSLVGLFTILSDLLDAEDQEEIIPLINEINFSLTALLNNETYFLSWQN